MFSTHYKIVGNSGQISLGKSLAGAAFLLEPLSGGDFILKKASIVPTNENWIYEPTVQARLAAADAWMQANPPSATDLDALEKKIL